MTVHSRMSETLFVLPETEIRDAARIMRDLDVAALPVWDGEHVLGIVTVRDIVFRQVATGRELGLVGSVMSPLVGVIPSHEPIRRRRSP